MTSCPGCTFTMSCMYPVLSISVVLGLNGKPSYVPAVGVLYIMWGILLVLEPIRIFFLCCHIHVVPVCTLSACLSLECVCLIWEPTFTNKGGHRSLVCIRTHTESCCSQQLWLRTYIWLYVIVGGRFTSLAVFQCCGRPWSEECEVRCFIISLLNEELN